MMKDSHVLWVSPEAPPRRTIDAAGTRLAAASTLRIGILDNAKSNADHLLEMLITALQTETPLASVVRRRKPGPAFPAKPDVLDDLARDADFVVSAMAD